MASQQFCLRWNNYQSNLMQVFDQLLQNESFVDVTLSCEGQSLKAHRMVLSACSPYFQCLLSEAPCHHPVIILQGVRWPELKAVVEFMYKGEINICQEQLGSLLRVAESLKVRGLAEVDGDGAEPAVLSSPALSPAIRIPSNPLDDSSTLGTLPRKRRRYSGDDGSRPCTPLTPNSGLDCVESQMDLNSSMMRAGIATGLPGSPASLASLAARLPGAMPPPAPMPPHLPHLPPLSPLLNMHSMPRPHAPDDFEIRPGIAEMIREEERRRRDAPDMAKLLESSHHWMGTSVADGGPPVFPTMFPARPAPPPSSHTAAQARPAPPPPSHTAAQARPAHTTSYTTALTASVSSSAGSKPRPSPLVVSGPPALAHPPTVIITNNNNININNNNNNMSQQQEPPNAPPPPVQCEIVPSDSPGHGAPSLVLAPGGSATTTPAGGGGADLELELKLGGGGGWGAPRGAMAAPKSGASRWTQRDLVAAVALVRAGTPIKPAAERCHIPVMTLWRRTRALGIVSSKVQCGFRYPAARRRPRPAPSHARIKPDPDPPMPVQTDISFLKPEGPPLRGRDYMADKVAPRAGPLREVSAALAPRLALGGSSSRLPGRENSPVSLPGPESAPPRLHAHDSFRAWVDIMVEGSGGRGQETPQDLTTHTRPPSRTPPPSSPAPPRPAPSPLH